MRRALHIVAVIIIIALVIGLYKAKTDASAARAHVAQLESEIADAQSDLRALRAQIAALESPAHVAELTAAHTQLQVGRQAQALPENALDQNLPPPRAPQGGAH